MLETTLYRLPMRSIGARYIDSAGVYLSMTFFSFLAQKHQLAWRGYALYITLLVIGIGMVLPIFDWFSTRIEISRNGLRFRTGVVAKTEINLDFAKCGSVQLETTVGKKLLGLAALKINDYRHTEANILIDGLTLPVANQLISDIEKTKSGGTSADKAPDKYASAEQQPEKTKVILQYNLADIISASLFNYEVVILLASILIVAAQVADNFRDASELTGMVIIPDGMRTTLVLLLAIVLVTVATIVRFHSLRVVRGKNSMEITHGILVERSKSIHLSDIAGTSITANVLELIFNRRSVSIVSVDTGLGTNRKKMTLRSLPLVSAVKLLDEISPQAKEAIPERNDCKTVVLCQSIAIVSGVLFFWLLRSSVSIYTLPLLSVTLAISVSYVFGVCFSSVQISNRGFIFRRCAFRSSAIYLSGRSNYGTTRIKLLQCPKTLLVYHLFLGHRMNFPVFHKLHEL